MERDGVTKNLLISIVDDDDSAREAVSGLVRSLGYLVAEFDCAAEFLSSGDVLQTACLIADLRMPGMTGLELYHHLIASGEPVPTILITAYPGASTRAQALQAGVQCYLEKPLEPDELVGCIHSSLARQTGKLE